jgi:hypothetical protein
LQLQNLVERGRPRVGEVDRVGQEHYRRWVQRICKHINVTDVAE